MEAIFILLLAFFAGLLWAVWNRKRGQGDKIWALMFMTLPLLMSMIHAVSREWGGVSALMIFVLTALSIGGMLLMWRPSWGEIFPHNKDTYDKDFAWGVRPVADFIAGYEYTKEVAEADDGREISWKSGAWIGRFAIYGLPLAIVCSVCAKSFAPIIALVLSSLWVGRIYERCFRTRKGSEDWIANAEKMTGFALGFILILSMF